MLDMRLIAPGVDVGGAKFQIGSYFLVLNPFSTARLPGHVARVNTAQPLPGVANDRLVYTT